eukprot:gnl/MRDRNA2_/MRDRNA2_27996_c0_seq1.p1 gnl/MRDRNA2_/MRDRNA2_27996_c0~~gnl/MRDRNA2_/MRDRNA2_27996_c0_seq1.p1  ORF type:complete len:731 (+),score=157.68 gnl/MRDRNA2_/MRDRNA2_27996_c0_seq1:301-2193(+)
MAALYKDSLARASAAVRAQRYGQLRKVARLLWRFRRQLPLLVASSGISAVCGAFSMLRLHYQAMIIDLARTAFTGEKSLRPSVGETIGAMFVGEAVWHLAEFCKQQLASFGKQKVIRELKVALFEALLRQDLEWLEEKDLYDQRYIIGNCGHVVGQVLDFPSIFLQCGIKSAASCWVLWKKSRSLAIFVALGLPLHIWFESVMEYLEHWLEQYVELPDFRGQVTACWQTLVRPASLRTMRAFAREPVEVSNFKSFLGPHDRKQEHGQLVHRILEPPRALLEHSVEIAALWFGGRLAVQGHLASGDLSSFVLLAQGAFDSLRFLRSAGQAVAQQALGPLAQMVSLLDLKPKIGLDVPPIENMPDPDSVKWSVRFVDVSFSYPQRPGAKVLDRVSFEINQGEFVGIVGGTGAGKSTIFGLLLRLYDPTEGCILLDGHDIREYNPLWLRRHFGIVSQELVLCEKTIRQNLFYGCHGIPPSDDEARKALQIAQCLDTFQDTAQFPQGWHTAVGDGGSNLSGGQKQRLGIARAILKRPRFLLLDEATSALDEVAQKKVQEALHEMRHHNLEMTVLCIAHRLSNLSNAQRLVVLEKGTVVEEGTHSELMSKTSGVFAEFAKMHHEAVPMGPGTNSE